MPSILKLKRPKRFPEIASLVLLVAAAPLAQLGCSTPPTQQDDGTGVNTSSEDLRDSLVVEHTRLPLIGDYKVDRFIFSNGLKLLVVEDHTSPTFSYQTWFNVGSRNEKKLYTGLAHLFEHMMFGSTKNRPHGEFDRLLEEAGAEGKNAFTSQDYTGYVVEMPKDKLDLLMDLESERMVDLIVDDKAFKTETEVVHNERRLSYENNPTGLMYQKLLDVAYTKHPYHWPIIGYAEDLDRMTSHDAYEFYQNFYHPGQATVVVVGDVDTNEVLELAKKHYGSIPPRPLLELNIPPEPAQKAPRQTILKLNMENERLLIGYKIPPINSDEAQIPEILQGLLTEGKSGRLNRTLVDSGIATSVSSGSYQHQDPTIFLIDVQLQKGRKAKTAADIVEREINKLIAEPVQQRELDRARNLVSFDFYQRLSSNEDKAHFLGFGETLLKHFSRELDLFKKSLRVSPSEIHAFAKTYLRPATRTTIMGVPK